MQIAQSIPPVVCANYGYSRASMLMVTVQSNKESDLPVRTIVYMAWGEKYIEDISKSISSSIIANARVIVVTDEHTPTAALPEDVQVIRKQIDIKGKLTKLKLLSLLPEDLGIILFLDVDTCITSDVSLGFEKAEKYGAAMAAAPHYSLEDFRNFGIVMDREGVPRQGQLLYNSGVMFLDTNHPVVKKIFVLADGVAEKDQLTTPWSDQPYITLAMEMLGFNPYTLSSSFNYRGFGELLSGQLRVWHSYHALPENASELPPGFLYRYEKREMHPAKKVPVE